MSEFFHAVQTYKKKIEDLEVKLANAETFKFHHSTMEAKIKELEAVNKDLIEKNVSILVMDYISQGVDLHYGSKMKELEAKLFNEKSHYENLHETYCLAFDYIAHILGKPNTDEAMEEFKKWITR